MKFDKLSDKVSGSAFFVSGVMFVCALLSFAVVFVTNRGDMTSAVLVIMGFMLLVTGLFILLTAERPSYPAYLTELMQAQETENAASVLADMGITSNTVHRYIEESGRVVQINPVAGGEIPDVDLSDTFVVKEDWSGAVYPAASSKLLAKLEKEDKLSVPIMNFELLEVCLNEIFCDSLGVAKKVTATRNDKSVSVTLLGFAPVKMCAAVQKTSPKCCTMRGCPICSLVAAVIAKSEGCDVMSDAAIVEKGNLKLAFGVYKRGE